MSRGIVKLAENEYVVWSTVVDSPVTPAWPRKELRIFVKLVGEDADWLTDDLFDEADRNGTTFGGSTEEFVKYNRAGKDETCITLARIRKDYAPRKRERDNVEGTVLMEQKMAEAEVRRDQINQQYPIGPGEVEMIATCTRKFECSQSIIRNQTLTYEFKPGDTVPARKGWGRMQGTPVEQWYILVDEHLAEPYDWFGIPADNAEAFFVFAPKPPAAVKKLGRKRIIIED